MLFVCQLMQSNYFKGYCNGTLNCIARMSNEHEHSLHYCMHAIETFRCTVRFRTILTWLHLYSCDCNCFPSPPQKKELICHLFATKANDGGSRYMKCWRLEIHRNFMHKKWLSIVGALNYILVCWLDRLCYKTIISSYSNLVVVETWSIEASNNSQAGQISDSYSCIVFHFWLYRMLHLILKSTWKLVYRNVIWFWIGLSANNILVVVVVVHSFKLPIAIIL